MKHVSITVVALSLLAAPLLVGAADQPANAPTDAANPAMNAPAANTNANPSAASQPSAVQAAPSNWTSLKGTVQAIDKTSKTLQIKDDSGSVIQVPVDRQVSIQKENGNKLRLSQVQPGDIVILAKKSAAPEASKNY